MFTDICSMRIFLVAATKQEIQPVIEQQSTGKLPGNRKHRLLFHTTGVGLVAATYSIVKLIENEQPDLIIQAGIGGCFLNGQLGKVVTVRADTIADMGVVEGNDFKNIFDLNLQHSGEFPYAAGLLKNPYHALMNIGSAEQVDAVSVNEISSNKTMIAYLQQRYSPYVESMEGASLHYVCLLEKIPFIQFRSVSNEIGERDKTKWKIKEAVTNLNDTVTDLLKKLEEYDENLFRI